MGYEIRWAVEAVDDLEHILRHLESNWDEKTIELFKQSISKRIKLLSRFPSMHPASSQNQLFRKSVLNKQTSIIYTIDQELVYIIRLLDNRSDHDY